METDVVSIAEGSRAGRPLYVSRRMGERFRMLVGAQLAAHVPVYTGLRQSSVIYPAHMEYGVSHSFDDESLEAKARWFMQKPIEQRLREAFEGMVLMSKLQRFEPADDRSTFKTVRVLERKAG